MYLNGLSHIKYSNDGTKCISVVSKSCMHNAGKKIHVSKLFQLITLYCHEGKQQLSFLFAKFYTFVVIIRLPTKAVCNDGLSMPQKLEWRLLYSGRHKAVISCLGFEASICFIFCNKLFFLFLLTCKTYLSSPFIF